MLGNLFLCLFLPSALFPYFSIFKFKKESHRYLAYSFQYRKRYEVYCNAATAVTTVATKGGFNTASGMRSIAIKPSNEIRPRPLCVSIPQAV